MKTLPTIILATGLSILPATKQGNAGVGIPGNVGYSNTNSSSSNLLYGKTEFKGIVQEEYLERVSGDSLKITHDYLITVQKGDNLSVIADRINSLNRMRAEYPFPSKISWPDVYNTNYIYGSDNISDPDKIYPGQRIFFKTEHEIPVFHHFQGLRVGS
ncbi:MAG: LysM domain-containing protein [Nanoarchaeota archaeon]